MRAALADRPLRVVVCGTTFGQVYLEGLRDPGPDLELVGVLGRGSERTERCAARYGVPAYGGPDELPGDVDAACVVVRSGLLGGAGAQLAQALMERGIHVIQEHPLHHDELASCLRTARRAGVVYHLNSFYPHVGPVRRFLAAAHELLGGQAAVYAQATCGFQLAFSLLDILGQALGGVRPWALADPSPHPPGAGEIPFRGLDGLIGGVPVSLRIQNQMDPGDPDNHAHADHRITLGTEAGSITLLNTHGPVVLCQRPHYPHAPRDPQAPPHYAGENELPPVPSATVLGPAQAPSYAEIFATLWPPAVQAALIGLREAILAGDDTLRRGQRHLSLCLLWQDITARLGPPELIRRASPTPLSPGRFAAVALAGGHALEAQATRA